MFNIINRSCGLLFGNQQTYKAKSFVENLLALISYLVGIDQNPVWLIQHRPKELTVFVEQSPTWNSFVCVIWSHDRHSNSVLVTPELSELGW